MSRKFDALVVYGPSGAGKGTLINYLMSTFSEKFAFSTSHTTRKPRQHEVDGIHYHFVTDEVYKQMVDNNMFVEHAHVHTANYGTSLQEIEKINKRGQIAVLDIDVQGASQVRGKINAFFLFISPPSLEVLEQRLRSRNTETEEELQVRLKNATIEMESRKEANYVLINNELQASYAEIGNIVKEQLF
ncbi:guanylate kinase [Entamoeba marina]